MTEDESLAKEITEDLASSLIFDKASGGRWLDEERAEELIAAAIREAVEAERRACAEIARQTAETFYGRESRIPLAEKEIIRAIEARSSAEEVG